jgi:hypothetical protein
VIAGIILQKAPPFGGAFCVITEIGGILRRQSRKNGESSFRGITSGEANAWPSAAWFSVNWELIALREAQPADFLRPYGARDRM